MTIRALPLKSNHESFASAHARRPSSVMKGTAITGVASRCRAAALSESTLATIAVGELVERTSTTKT